MHVGLHYSRPRFSTYLPEMKRIKTSLLYEKVEIGVGDMRRQIALIIGAGARCCHLPNVIANVIYIAFESTLHKTLPE